MRKTKHLQVPQDESQVDNKRRAGEVEERGNWTGKFDFILSALGYAVGLGNVWRFPYLCFKHGGGSFVIAYVVMLVFLGVPVMFLEFSIGQFSALASLPLFKNLSPLFNGIGYSIIFTSILGSSCYVLVLSWSFFYFFDSFRSDLQWQYCQHSFNTESCFSNKEFEMCEKTEGIYLNHTCFNSSDPAYTLLDASNSTSRTSPYIEYFQKYVIGRSSGIEDFGSFNWRIYLCILLSWTLVFLSCIKGVKSSGKVVYFTATFPYLMLLILLVRGATLEGAYDGVVFYLTPKWWRLGEITIWQEAAIQIFLSLGVGSGGAVTLASYNKFKTNVVRDALVVSIGNCVTSVFAGFAIFTIIGHIAFKLHKNIDDVIEGGPELAFVVYPEAVSLLPLSPMWSIFFFLMLITLGLDSLFGTIENMVSSVVDDIPRLRSKKIYVLLGLCVLGSFIGIPLAHGSGIYWIDLTFAVIGWKNLLIAIIEFIVIGYLYGMTKFMFNLKAMTGWTPNKFITFFMKLCFMFLTPAIIFILLLFTFINYKPFESGKKLFPPWANALGWIISFSSITIIIIFSFIILYKHRSIPIKTRLKFLTTETDRWYENYNNERANLNKSDETELTEITERYKESNTNL